MGKIFLSGVLILALSPVALVGFQTPGQRFNRAVARLESKYEGQLGRIYEAFGTDCAWDLSEEDANEFMQKIDSFNSRRRRDYVRHGLTPPSDVPYCAGYGYGA